MTMPAGRLLRLLRSVGRPRHHSTYRRVGKAVQPPGADPDARDGGGGMSPNDPATDAPEPRHPNPEPREEAAAQNPEGEAREAPRAEESSAGPMEVLYMREPSVVPGKQHPPMPFTHYFDTYEMVNRLTAAEFKRGQAVSTMKAVRMLLRDKMEEAQGRLVSKGDVDNVSWPLRFLSLPTWGQLSCSGSGLTTLHYHQLVNPQSQLPPFIYPMPLQKSFKKKQQSGLKYIKKNPKSQNLMNLLPES